MEADGGPVPETVGEALWGTLVTGLALVLGMTVMAMPQGLTGEGAGLAVVTNMPVMPDAASDRAAAKGPNA